MKKFKKLIPALCMLLISAVLMGTSTYAWFSMNNKVTVSGMTVTAKSDATYLVISNDTTLETTTSLTRSINGAILPVSYTNTEIKNNANDTTLVNAGKWFTAEGTSTTDGTAKVDTKKELTIAEANNKGTANNKDYYVVDTFYIGLTAGSSAVQTGKGIQADVTFTATSSSNLNKSLKVVIVYGETGTPSAGTTTQSYSFSSGTGTQKVFSKALQEHTLITATATKVTVYIYFDGEDPNCTTANAINLAGISVSIDFYVNEDLHE